MGNSISVYQSFAHDPSELDEIGVWVPQVVICPFTHCLYGFPEMAYFVFYFCYTFDHSKHHVLK